MSNGLAMHFILITNSNATLAFLMEVFHPCVGLNPHCASFNCLIAVSWNKSLVIALLVVTHCSIFLVESNDSDSGL